MANEVIGPRRTVILAGISPGGEPVTVNETVLATGLDADGVARYLSVDADGNLASSGGSGAELSTNNPANVGYAPVPGSGVAASKDDHVHDIALTNAMAQLAADVAMATANTFYDGPSLSLAAGIWLVTASVHFTGPEAGYTLKIWDGTTVFASANHSGAGNGYSVQLPATAIVTLVATTTVKASVTCSANTATLKKATGNNPSGDTATTIVAVRVG